VPIKKKTARKRVSKRLSTHSKKRPGPLRRLALRLLGFAVLATCLFIFARDELGIDSPEQDRAIANNTELQVALAREGFSPGSIDGDPGAQTKQALGAFQVAHQLLPSGVFDSETARALRIVDPVYARVELTVADFARVATKPSNWVDRGKLDAMHFNSVLEMVAEHAQSDPDYIRALNPTLNWEALNPGDQILVPHVLPFQISGELGYVRIQLAQRILQAFDHDNRLRFHCPVSIARNVGKRPTGQLAVKVLVDQPNYTFNPNILSQTAQREGITQKFIIQPGPNNPVGSVWIGLNLPSYGIHGTPEPEKVGRTESSGCFRLANWNAKTLLKASWVGMSVQIDP